MRVGVVPVLIEVYELSPRQLAPYPPEHWYSGECESRRVRSDGGIKWTGAQVFVGEAFGATKRRYYFVVGGEAAYSPIVPVV